MNLQQLEAVCGIARHGYNMSAAAEALGRTQSALSRQLKDLESELGVQIFVCARNKMVGLTPQGERVLRVGQRVLKDLKTLGQIAGEDTPEASGELRSATDADVCKAYVEVGMGVAVLATIAYDPAADRGLAAMDAGHLFRPGILNVVFRKHGYLTRPLESFLSLFAPHLDRDLIRRALDGADIERACLGQRAPVARMRHAVPDPA